MIDKNEVVLTKWSDAYRDTMALYVTLNGGSTRNIRRAELKQGEVAPDPTDFLADVLLKARRILTPIFYEMLLRLAENDKCELLPPEMQQSLGKVFLERKLGPSGDYKRLYFRAKNQQMREMIARDDRGFPEEEMEAEDILDGD